MLFFLLFLPRQYCGQRQRVVQLNSFLSPVEEPMFKDNGRNEAPVSGILFSTGEHTGEQKQSNMHNAWILSVYCSDTHLVFSEIMPSPC
jgi:hypothetical protein